MPAGRKASRGTLPPNYSIEFILLYQYDFTRAGPAPRALRCEQRFIVPKSLRIERGKGPTREPQRPFFRNDARGRHRLFCVKTKARCSDRLWARRCSIRKYATNELTRPRLIPRVPCSQGGVRTALRIAPPVSSPNSRQLGRCGQAGLALGDGGALSMHVAHASRSDFTLEATYIMLRTHLWFATPLQKTRLVVGVQQRARHMLARGGLPVVATVPCARKFGFHHSWSRKVCFGRRAAHSKVRFARTLRIMPPAKAHQQRAVLRAHCVCRSTGQTGQTGQIRPRACGHVPVLG